MINQNNNNNNEDFKEEIPLKKTITCVIFYAHFAWVCVD